jgi:hypothetical protein
MLSGIELSPELAVLNCLTMKQAPLHNNKLAFWGTGN